jgi:hypothetical protein
MHFLLCLEQKKDPYLLSQYDRTSPQAHQQEVRALSSKLSAKTRGFDGEVQDIISQIILAGTPQSRGSLGQIVSR